MAKHGKREPEIEFPYGIAAVHAGAAARQVKPCKMQPNPASYELSLSQGVCPSFIVIQDVKISTAMRLTTPSYNKCAKTKEPARMTANLA
jgi:hypothetical protein